MKHDFNTLHLLWAIRSMPKNLVNGHEKSLLFILLSSTGYQNSSWYSLRSISEMSGFSLDTVRRNIRTLEQKKIIIVEKPSTYSRKSSNQYILNIDLIMIYCPELKDSSQPSLKKERVAHSNGRVAASYPERVAESQQKKERKERKEEGTATPSVEGVLSPSEKLLPNGFPDYSHIKKIPMPDEVRKMIWGNTAVKSSQH